MSLIPFLLDDVLSDRNRSRLRPRTLIDQNFGLGVLTDDLLHTHHSLVPILSGYYRPWRHQATRNSGISNIENSKDGFKVSLDVQQFKPEEVTVKMVGNCVVVEGKHEERQDEHGFISRQFLRRYTLPEDVDPDTVSSKLSSDGILTVEGPKKVLPPSSTNERIVSIAQINSPAVTQAPPKENAKDDAHAKMDQ